MKKNKMMITQRGSLTTLTVSPDIFIEVFTHIVERLSLEVPEADRIAPSSGPTTGMLIDKIPEAYRMPPFFKIYHVKGDSRRIVAKSPADFLHQLRIGSRFDSQGTDIEYMHRFARRLQELEGYLVSTDTPETFLADLVAHGFVSYR